MQIDIRIAEMMCSRICHDLSGPIGAMRNGIELIEDLGHSDEEAVRLVGENADQATRRLRLFRLAYGFAGEMSHQLRDFRTAARDWLADGRVRLDWAGIDNETALAQRRGGAKVLLNALVLAADTLARGGTVIVSGEARPVSAAVTITATGPVVVWAAEAAAALSGHNVVEDISPQTVHPYVTGLFARHFGLSLVAKRSEPPSLQLLLSW